MSSRIRIGILLCVICGFFGLSLQTSHLTPNQILDLVNQDRSEAGLPPLLLNSTLNLAAFAKAEDMLSKRYFAHVSPEGTKPWYWFKMMGYHYTYAGENLALGYKDPSELVDSWMASDSHRSNILSPLYSDLGLAIVEDEGNTMVVQLFGSKSQSLSLRQ